MDLDKKLVIERQRDIIFGVMSSAEAERGPSEASFVWAGAALPPSLPSLPGSRIGVHGRMDNTTHERYSVSDITEIQSILDQCRRY